MKAVVAECCVRSHPGIKTCMAGKTSPGRCDFDSKEMMACFSKLQDLVPSAKRRDGRIDKTELLQSVIDYIYHLEDTLAVASGGLCGVLDSTLSRRPLAEQNSVCLKSTDITSAEGDLLATVQNFTRLGDLDLRPPSQ